MMVLEKKEEKKKEEEWTRESRSNLIVRVRKEGTTCHQATVK